MKNMKMKIIGVIAFLIVAGIYYYVTLPAINIHSKDFWVFLIILMVLLIVWYGWKKKSARKKK